MKLIPYLRHNPDLTVAMLFAVVVSSLVPFSLTATLDSINVPLLGLLFCLMSIVAGLRQSGLFTYAYRLIFKEHNTTSRALGRFFIFSCFFSSILITNDVSLIVFVPLAIADSCCYLADNCCQYGQYADAYWQSAKSFYLFLLWSFSLRFPFDYVSRRFHQWHRDLSGNLPASR